MLLMPAFINNPDIDSGSQTRQYRMSDDFIPLRFLDFPFDIREQIYIALVTETRNHSPIGRNREAQAQPAPSPRYSPIIRVTRPLPSTPTLNFLLTNRQIRSELTSTIESIARNQKGIKYTLDLTVSGGYLYTTWISLPASLRFLSHVHVYFNIEPNSDPDAHPWWEEGEPSGFTQSLIQLFSDFLVYGPSFRPSDPYKPEPLQPRMMLNDLTIEFVRVNPNVEPVSFDFRRLLWLAHYGEHGSDGWNMGNLFYWLHRVGISGQLNGRVKTLRFAVGDATEEWIVDEHPTDRMLDIAEHWARYGWKSMADAIEKGL